MIVAAAGPFAAGAPLAATRVHSRHDARLRRSVPSVEAPANSAAGRKARLPAAVRVATCTIPRRPFRRLTMDWELPR